MMHGQQNVKYCQSCILLVLYIILSYEILHTNIDSINVKLEHNLDFTYKREVEALSR